MTFYSSTLAAAAAAAAATSDISSVSVSVSAAAASASSAAAASSASASASAVAASASQSASNERNSVAVGNAPVTEARPNLGPHLLALPPVYAVYVRRRNNAPPRWAPPPPQRDLSFLRRTVAWAFFIFFVTAVFSFLVWLIFHPTFPQLHVASATMSAITITSTTATADCNLTILLTNPNRFLTTLYDSMEISLLYPSQHVLLSQDFQPPFEQSTKNHTTMEINLGFTDADLGKDVVQAMKQDFDRGGLRLGIKILAIVRYRIGKWKTHSQFMRAYCGGVTFGFDFSDDKKLEKFLKSLRECVVYLYSK